LGNSRFDAAAKKPWGPSLRAVDGGVVMKRGRVDSPGERIGTTGERIVAKVGERIETTGQRIVATVAEPPFDPLDRRLESPVLHTAMSDAAHRSTGHRPPFRWASDFTEQQRPLVDLTGAMQVSDARASIDTVAGALFGASLLAGSLASILPSVMSTVTPLSVGASGLAMGNGMLDVKKAFELARADSGSASRRNLGSSASNAGVSSGRSSNTALRRTAANWFVDGFESVG
jgi:hypothetical protein